MRLTHVVTLVLLTLLLLAFSTSAMADSFALPVTNGFTTCPTFSGVTECAIVNLTINPSGKAVFTVTSLLNGYQFDTFGFNYTGGGTLALVGASGAINTSDPSYGLSGPGSFAQDGFGKFTYLFDTGVNGGSTGSNCQVTASGVASAGCIFSITLSGSSLSTSLFESLSSGGAGNGNVYYAGHVAGSTCTGYVGGPANSGTSNGTSGCVPPVPEPATFMLLGPGLGAIGFMIRRKLGK